MPWPMTSLPRHRFGEPTPKRHVMNMLVIQLSFNLILILWLQENHLQGASLKMYKNKFRVKYVERTAYPWGLEVLLD